MNYYILGMDANGLVVLFDKFGINVPLLSIQIVNFIIVVYLLYRFAFRDILKSMDQRNKQIQDGLKYTEKIKIELNNIEDKKFNIISDANAKANDIICNAKESALTLMEKQKAESKKIAEDIKLKAQSEIKNERDLMFNEMKNGIKEIIIQTTEKVLSRELSLQEKESYQQRSVDILINAI